ncbi:hypothetical protein BGW39_000347 [Mortierella sp. 14UC]|nr:hypothetical protein BGW39_000347 [Mortierella sp. 14UC]
MGLADEFLHNQTPTLATQTPCGLISIICLIVFGIVSLNVLWSIIGCDNFLNQFQNSYFRAVAYIVFAVLMWLAVGVGGRTLQVISALTLTFGAVSYVIAAARHQTPASSTITGGTGVSTIV